MLTHAEPRLKPLPDPFLASAANTGTQKRSHSYSGYIPYHLRLTLENLGNGAHNGHSVSPRCAVAASGSADAGCPPQFCPDTDSETETYVWTQSSRGTLSGVPPPVWNLPLPNVWTVNRVHSGLPPVKNTRYVPYCLQLPSVPAGADYMRQTSMQHNKGVPNVSAAELTSGSRQLVSAGSTRHDGGQCKPCAFVHKGRCTNGTSCDFCHLCSPGEKKRRQREKIKQVKAFCRVRKERFRSIQFYNQ